MGVPDFNFSQWNSLDAILYNLAGRYQSRYRGAIMLVEFVHVNSIPPKSASPQERRDL